MKSRFRPSIGSRRLSHYHNLCFPLSAGERSWPSWSTGLSNFVLLHPEDLYCAAIQSERVAAASMQYRTTSAAEVVTASDTAPWRALSFTCSIIVSFVPSSAFKSALRWPSFKKSLLWQDKLKGKTHKMKCKWNFIARTQTYVGFLVLILVLFVFYLYLLI